MIALTDEMRQAFATALADGAPDIVATADPATGEPDIAFKGSAMVFDAEHLAFWERAHGQTLRNLRANPRVCLLYRNPKTRTARKFFGHAELHEAGDLRQQVMDRTIPVELERDPERRGIAVLVRVDRVLQAGQVIMARE
ncbi:pyridoxamine 5'-phosphate oxidase family protein [Tepidiforma sp.]|uniref:pyridoxamine 5'-phosphate oxidase family protein n=1 Tax=Tepidiforma sp. TaxID=2682230 RepID=UPI002ADD8ADA|nr:pyridoxamine 5'-phosphate oxidase family protein [Tepidiforma sp.]